MSAVADRPTTTTPDVGYRFPVSEVYGPVCQGEGRLIGRPTIFIRLGGCDYRCAWCDSLYAVLPKHRADWAKLGPTDIVDRALALGPCRHVTLSGGNPAIHPLGPLILALHRADYRIAIETQGSTVPAPWLVEIDDVTLSPKPPSSGNVTPFGAGTRLAGWLDGARHTASVCVKVVAFDEADYRYAVDVHRAHPDAPFVLQAGTAVGSATRDDLCDALASWQDRVLGDPDMQDVAVLPQLHAVLKGHARGI